MSDSADDRVPRQAKMPHDIFSVLKTLFTFELKRLSRRNL